MKLSKQLKLRFGIAAGFIALSTYVVAQSPASPSDYEPTNNPELSSPDLSNSEFGRTNAEDQQTKLNSSSPTTTEETTTRIKKGKKKTVTKRRSNSSHRMSLRPSASP